jgi:hypothetical protein
MQKDSLPKCVIFSIEAEQILPFSFLSFFFVVLGMEARALHIEVSLFFPYSTALMTHLFLAEQKEDNKMYI